MFLRLNIYQKINVWLKKKKAAWPYKNWRLGKGFGPPMYIYSYAEQVYTKYVYDSTDTLRKLFILLYWTTLYKNFLLILSFESKKMKTSIASMYMIPLTPWENYLLCFTEQLYINTFVNIVLQENEDSVSIYTDNRISAHTVMVS